jgi:hypothetical protein
MKMRPMVAEMFYADEQTGGQTEANSLFFRNFANVPNKNVLTVKEKCY